MDEKSGIAGVPDAVMTARLLPGEEGGVTIFGIFWNNRRHVGHTDSSAFDLVNDASLEAPELSSPETAWCFMDAGVVPKVVTGCNGGRFEPEKWSRRLASLQLPDDVSRSTRVCFRTFCLRNQTYTAHISKREFYHSTHKTHGRSHPCPTSKW